jgi:uncharacterized protein YdhG (YjbR/CyaY superfamily)
MAGKRPTTVAEYIKAAKPERQPHLRRLHKILSAAAPKAEQVMKWGTPFFVEPRFLFAFGAFKNHINFVVLKGLAPFKKELKKHKLTRGALQIFYSEPFPTDLVRRIARRRVKDVGARKDDKFW